MTASDHDDIEDRSDEDVERAKADARPDDVWRNDDPWQPDYGGAPSEGDPDGSVAHLLLALLTLVVLGLVRC